MLYCIFIHCDQHDRIITQSLKSDGDHVRGAQFCVTHAFLVLQYIETEVAAKQEDIQKMNKDLELTEQLCGHLQKSFHEYCPDIHRQETEVRNLRNRYANISNQLQQR